jgi:stage II sporulation protein E
LREEGKITREQLKGTLKECPQAGGITDRINEGYARFVIRENAFRRLSEIRAVVGDQFYAMSSMLTELSGVFADAVTVDEVASARVREVCERFSLPLTEVLCTVGAGRRMTVDVMLSDTTFSIDEATWRGQLNEVCGRMFQPPQITRMGSAARILLRERPRYKVAVGQAQLTPTGERLCGDAAEVFTDAEGRTVMVLSDGMGCGGRAAVDGAMTAGLTARLLQAGFGADSVLRMVNAALMVKGGSESLATLDVAVIDPFTGKTTFLKAGAATSLLLSAGRVSRVEPSSLPLGILREVTFARCEDQLASGDVLLLFSDGAVSESVAAAEEILRDYDADKGSMQNLAEKVASAARRLQQAKGGHEDDITVLAARVYVHE